MNQKVLLRLLERLGYRATAVADGREALAMLEQAPFDVLITDVQMPVMDGHELAREVRRREGNGAHLRDPRHDRRGHERRPRAMPRKRHGRLPEQAGQPR
ncbi:MAG: response regulator [Planctomycetota bacterium]